MGALHFRAALRAVRSHARRRRISFAAPTGVDHRRHDRSALRRHGIQPLGRRVHRRRQSPHQHARPARRASFARVCSYIRSRVQRHFHSGSQPAQPTSFGAFPGRARGAASLLLYQACDAMVASGAGLRARHCACRSVDRRPRFARSAHPAADRRCDLLGGRLRRSLRLPGFRFRPPQPACIPSRATSAFPLRFGLRAPFTPSWSGY